MRVFTFCIAFMLFIQGFEELEAQDTNTDTQVIRLMQQKGRSMAQDEYFIKLLELALEKTKDSHGPYQLAFTDTAYYQRKGLINMRRGENIDVIFTMTSKSREMVFRPVRIPLLKGLTGHRISFVKKGDEEIMADVNRKEDLEKITFTQGTDWPDTEILEKNGLRVIKNKKYDYNNLFEILLSGEAEAFPRAATEIISEKEVHKDKEIAIENNVVIYYPTAYYYFFNKADIALADRIKAGLEKAVNDGSFQDLFDTYNSQYIKKLNLANRTYIKLENPLLPRQTPVGQSKYWLDIGK